jgi:hypothetical protein
VTRAEGERLARLEARMEVLDDIKKTVDTLHAAFLKGEGAEGAKTDISTRRVAWIACFCSLFGGSVAAVAAHLVH